MTPSHSKSLGAFTLIELLVVIAIIGVVAGVSLPIYNRALERANETKTLSNMRQIGAGIMLYTGDNNSALPGRVSDDSGGSLPKWPSLLQPYVQDAHAFSSPIPSVGTKSYAVTDTTLYFKSPYSINYTSYIYNGWSDMGAYSDSTVTPRLGLMERPNQTILFGIPLPQAGQFYMDFAGTDNRSTVLNWTAFSNGCPYVFGDGSARILVYDTTLSGVTYKTSQPPSSSTYSDWYWLMNKANTSAIH